MAAASPNQFLSPPLLVDRVRELDLLRTRLATVLDGHGGLVLIGGEAGVGKTTIAEALCHDAQARGARVVVGRCYDLTETPPYGPWIEIAQQFRAVTDSASTSIGPAIRSLESAANQASLFAQARDFLLAASVERPLVLLLEDCHWADLASLDLLRFVARAADRMPVLLVVTYRAEELDRRHPLHTLMPLLVREARAERIVVGPLGVSDVRTLVTAHHPLPEPDTVRLSTYLMARSEGNALFLAELLRALEEGGVLYRDADARWRIGAIDQVSVPPLLRQVIDGRLARFGDEAVALLAVAAVIGQEVSLATWQRVTDADEEALSLLLERAEAAHLATGWSDGDGMRFRHALIRDALYESLPPPQRRRIHRRVGEVLSTLPSPDPDAVAGHFRRSGDPRAAAWLVEAGERAERAHALLTAADRYEAAVALLDVQGGDAAERGWLRLLIAYLRRYQENAQALLHLEEASRLAREAGDDHLATRVTALRGLLQIYESHIRAGTDTLSEGVAAIEALPPGFDDPRRRAERVDIIANRGTLIASLAFVGRFSEARAEGERYIRAATTGGHAGVAAVADAWNGLAFAYAMLGAPDDARRAYAHARRAYEDADHRLLVLFMLRNDLAHVLVPYQADNRTECERIAAAARAEALRLISAGTAEEEVDYAGFPGLPLLILDGRWQEARRIAEAVDTLNIANEFSFRDSMLGPLARAQGDLDRAWQLVRETWPDGPVTEPGDRFVLFALPLLRLAVDLALDAGDLPTAQPWLGAHDRWLDQTGAVLGRSEGAAVRARYERARGHREQAYQSAQKALADATEPHQPLALIAAHRLIGELDTDARRFAAARDHLGQSLALAEACHAPYERALTLLAFAAFHLAAGEAEQARPVLEEVRGICTRLGARPALTRADALAAQLDARDGARPAYPAGLTAREVEVLRLVAAGLTNAEIAERLFVSRGTVKIHLVHIYDKIGVSNRAGAVRFATDHGLD